MSTEILSLDDRIEVLERRANAVRSRFMRTLDALDTRRHQVVELGDTAKKLAVPAAITVASAVALVGVGALVVSIGLRRRRRRPWLAKAATELVERLELARRPPLGRRLLEKAALAFVSIAAAEVARVASKNLLDGRYPDGRLAVGRARALPPARHNHGASE